MVNPSFEPSAPVPTLAASSGGLAASLGLCANARYQVIGGIDRYLFDRCSMLWVYLIFSGAVRLVSNRAGEPIRLHLQVSLLPSQLHAVVLGAPSSGDPPNNGQFAMPRGHGGTVWCRSSPSQILPQGGCISVVHPCIGPACSRRLNRYMPQVLIYNPSSKLAIAAGYPFYPCCGGMMMILRLEVYFTKRQDISNLMRTDSGCKV